MQWLDPLTGPDMPMTGDYYTSFGAGASVATLHDAVVCGDCDTQVHMISQRLLALMISTSFAGQPCEKTEIPRNDSPLRHHTLDVVGSGCWLVEQMITPAAQAS